MYGVLSDSGLDNTILEVTGVLGNGANNTAHLLLSETAQTESDYGQAIDYHWSSGYGVMQFDQIAIDDTIARTPQHIKQKIIDVWGVDLDRVTGAVLQWSPLVSVIMARLKYRLIPAEIPATRVARAEYWKKYYNTYLGKGTIEHYMKMTENERFS